MKRVLFFSNSPDLSASLRFFINVPVFMVLAAGVLWWSGDAAITSRWTPGALALTHLLTLGVLASAMIGALLQILPVSSNVYVARTRLTAAVVHTGLTAGTVFLALSFLVANALMAQLAFVLLSVAFGWLLTAVAIGFWTHRHTRSMGSTPLFRAAQLALLALLFTVLLGISLLSVRAWGVRLAVPGITDIHAIWGLVGWVGILLTGVTFKIIPVFQATELYPRPLMRFLTPAIFSLLVLWTILVIWLPPQHVWLTTLTGLLLGIVLCIYAAISLRLLYTRKRPAPDTTTRFWIVAMSSFLACLPVWLWSVFSPDPRTAVTLGILMIVGVAVSAINGMLYKIIPILLWNHAQLPLKSAHPAVPKVKDILPDSVCVKQFWVQLAAYILLLGASRWPATFMPIAAMLSALSGLWLARNIVMALQVYRQAKKAIHASAH